jgi:hypothetical protein
MDRSNRSYRDRLKSIAQGVGRVAKKIAKNVTKSNPDVGYRKTLTDLNAKWDKELSGVKPKGTEHGQLSKMKADALRKAMSEYETKKYNLPKKTK